MADLLRQASGAWSATSYSDVADQPFTAPQSMEGLLLKEGVYCAVGHSPSDLESYIKFDSWLEETLVPEAAGTDSK